jgi:hypothetical protein
MLGVSGPGMSCGGKRDIRYIKTGDDFYYSGKLYRFANIDLGNEAVSDGGMEHLPYQRVSVNQIVRVLRSPSHFFVSINTGNTLSYYHGTSLLLKFVTIEPVPKRLYSSVGEPVEPTSLGSCLRFGYFGCFGCFDKLSNRNVLELTLFRPIVPNNLLISALKEPFPPHILRKDIPVIRKIHNPLQPFLNTQGKGRHQVLVVDD